MNKQVSLIMLGLLLISMMAFLPNIAHSYTPADYKASIIAAADRLVALQSVLPGPPADGGWDWIVTGLASHTANPSAYNLFGVTALGLIDAYELTGNAAYLTAAGNTADFMKYGNPSNGDFSIGHDAYHWGYSYDYRFLMSYSAASGDPDYMDYALDAWTWQKANKASFTDGNQETLWDYYPDPGYAAWGTSDWGLATLRMGDTAWATNMATVMHNHKDEILLSDPMAMGSALRFLATIGGYADDVTDLKEELLTLQELDGSWEFPGYPYPCTQSVAYAVMGLWAAGEYTAAQKGADWLVSTQGTLVALPGGWPQTNYDPTYCETSETDSEPLQATFAVTSYASKLYIDPPLVNNAPGDSFFDVCVTLENFGNLAGFDIKLTWDNTLITCSSVDYTTYMDALWGIGKWSKVFENPGAGFYELAAVALATSASNTGASVLFKVTFHIEKSCNFELSTPISFDAAKLSDNGTPTPNPIVPGTVTGCVYTISGTNPDLEFELVDPNPAKPFEYCKIFEVKIYATHICANLKDYDFTILYDAGHLKCLDVDYWGVLGDNVTGEAGYTITTGIIHVWDMGGVTQTGDKVWLFTLTFHVEFNDDITHIWKKNSPHSITADIWFGNAQLSFLEGLIDMGGITMPPTLVITINLIRGDVNCDGTVTMADISSVAFYFGQTALEKYDLTQDGIIDIYDLVTIATNYSYGM